MNYPHQQQSFTPSSSQTSTTLPAATASATMKPTSQSLKQLNTFHSNLRTEPDSESAPSTKQQPAQQQQQHHQQQNIQQSYQLQSQQQQPQRAFFSNSSQPQQSAFPPSGMGQQQQQQQTPTVYTQFGQQQLQHRDREHSNDSFSSNQQHHTSTLSSEGSITSPSISSNQATGTTTHLAPRNSRLNPIFAPSQQYHQRFQPANANGSSVASPAGRPSSFHQSTNNLHQQLQSPQSQQQMQFLQQQQPQQPLQQLQPQSQSQPQTQPESSLTNLTTLPHSVKEIIRQEVAFAVQQINQKNQQSQQSQQQLIEQVNALEEKQQQTERTLEIVRVEMQKKSTEIEEFVSQQSKFSAKNAQAIIEIQDIITHFRKNYQQQFISANNNPNTNQNKKETNEKGGNNSNLFDLHQIKELESKLIKTTQELASETEIRILRLVKEESVRIHAILSQIQSNSKVTYSQNSTNNNNISASQSSSKETVEIMPITNQSSKFIFTKQQVPPGAFNSTQQSQSQQKSQLRQSQQYTTPNQTKTPSNQSGVEPSDSQPTSLRSSFSQNADGTSAYGSVNSPGISERVIGRPSVAVTTQMPGMSNDNSIYSKNVSNNNNINTSNNSIHSNVSSSSSTQGAGISLAGFDSNSIKRYDDFSKEIESYAAATTTTATANNSLQQGIFRKQGMLTPPLPPTTNASVTSTQSANTNKDLNSSNSSIGSRVNYQSLQQNRKAFQIVEDGSTTSMNSSTISPPRIEQICLDVDSFSNEIMVSQSDKPKDKLIDNLSMIKEEEDEEIVYQIDEFGYLLNETGNPVLDDSGQRVRLDPSQFEYLQAHEQ